jgi:8-oxo-dGTP pyrophosphatase MutT (NUDIX family)
MTELHHVTISIAKNQDGKYLIIKSPKWKHWVFPGGHIENGETIEEAAIRELKEETGVEGKHPKHLMTGELINSPDFYKPAHFKYEVVLFETDNPVVIMDKREVISVAWLPLSGLRTLDVIAPDHYSVIFDKLEVAEKL